METKRPCSERERVQLNILCLEMVENLKYSVHKESFELTFLLNPQPLDYR